MKTWLSRLVLPSLLLLCAVGCARRALPEASTAAKPPDAASPSARALAYLSAETPRWAAEHHCYSCHNNGDAARALLAGRRRGVAVPEAVLADTTRWLGRPLDWDKKGEQAEWSDRDLARLQFAAALVDLNEKADAAARSQAAAMVAEGQAADGSWPVGAAGLGGPTTYGAALATVQARHVLRQTDPVKYRDALVRADRWLRTTPVKNVLTAAAVLLGLAGSDDAAAQQQRQACLDLIRQGQGKDGGWGPYVSSSPEVFDTALVLLALTADDRAAHAPLLRGGRAYLVACQEPDGSWPETTRPSGGVSYAQRISTTAWAALALLATESPWPAATRPSAASSAVAAR